MRVPIQTYLKSYSSDSGRGSVFLKEHFSSSTKSMGLNLEVRWFVFEVDMPPPATPSFPEVKGKIGITTSCPRQSVPAKDNFERGLKSLLRSPIKSTCNRSSRVAVGINVNPDKQLSLDQMHSRAK